MKTRIDAIEFLQADKIGADAWRYYAAETQESYKVSGSDLDRLAELLSDESLRDAYSLWCCECPAEAID